MTFILALAGMAAALDCPAQTGAVGYQVREVLPAAGFDSIQIIALNNSGQVVGGMDSSSNQTHAYLWEDGRTTDLGTFGGSKALASGINDSGEIVGTFLTNGSRHAFLWQKGVLDDLGEIDQEPHLGFEGALYQGGPGRVYWIPQIAINNRGQVVGHFWGQSFLLSDRKISYFGPMTNNQIFYGERISDNGDIIGRATQPNATMRATLWRNGAPIDLGSIGGGSSSIGGINNLGVVVGSSTLVSNGPARGFVWENGNVRWLVGGEFGDLHPDAINSAGDAVGYVSRPGGGFPCLWKGGRIYDLSVALRLEASWRAVAAHAINERGQIWLTATNGRGPVRYFLLTPFNSLVAAFNWPAAPEVHLATVAPFNLTSLERLDDGRFRLRFASGVSGNNVEASTNLKDWVVLGPATNNAGVIEYIDADAPKYLMRFYRLAPAP